MANVLPFKGSLNIAAALRLVDKKMETKTNETYTYAEMLLLAEHSATFVPNYGAVFQTEVCGRCGGCGRYSWCQMYGDKCFGCQGTGKVMSGECDAYYHARSRVAERRVSNDLVGRIVNNPSQTWQKYPKKFLWEVTGFEAVGETRIITRYGATETTTVTPVCNVTARNIWTGETITACKSSLWVLPTFAEVYAELEKVAAEAKPRTKARKNALGALAKLRAYEALQLEKLQQLRELGEAEYEAKYAVAK